ncbi:response regulator, partial [Chroococcidiopsis cubana CCALA 043]
MAKILVIEDEPDVRNNLVELLESEDFDVASSENGLMGALWAQQYLPDLIICDVMMPEIDGYEVLAALREEATTATIPFVFLTAMADKANVRQGMELGADDYLTKPFTREELLGAVTTRLAKQQAVAQQYQAEYKRAEALKQRVQELQQYIETKDEVLQQLQQNLSST